MEPSVITINDTNANPAPLGLLAFGMTTVLLNLHNAGIFEMNSMILAMGIFYGGIAQVTKRLVQYLLLPAFFLFPLFAGCQVITGSAGVKIKTDSGYVIKEDTFLRIKNFSPYFTLHVDSTLDYHFEINREPQQYYWHLKNSPVGLKTNKDNGVLH